ncbi:stress responsive A/B barrel domain-containing protein [Viridothelium virens]|uniref:Stress responsive A/B barrel domain-containing protein n=1 Tax=Viridothelium virens TaxID=1048519 RepID=A0A6A6H7D1_VIRVR|nr:stress responsive A/B barrel domain-containing protein [Viridothelium virens]
MASEAVVRSTLFKVPNPADIDGILEKYSTLKKDAKKDGKPYILEVNAGKANTDPRNQGYSFLAVTKFASVEDMNYYDNQCEAHQAIKASAKGKIEPPPLMVYTTNAVGS